MVCMHQSKFNHNKPNLFLWWKFDFRMSIKDGTKMYTNKEKRKKERKKERMIVKQKEIKDTGERRT